MTGAFSIAVHALVYLHLRDECLSSETLGENICTNATRVRKIMARLKRAELVHTKEGAAGGYTFCLDAETVTLDRVARAVDARFVRATWHSGDADRNCLVASGMAGVMDGVYDRLQAQCLEELSAITVGDIARQLLATAEHKAIATREPAVVGWGRR